MTHLRIYDARQRKRAWRFLSKPLILLLFMARPAGFEPTTPWFVVSHFDRVHCVWNQGLRAHTLRHRRGFENALSP